MTHPIPGLGERGARMRAPTLPDTCCWPTQAAICAMFSTLPLDPDSYMHWKLLLRARAFRAIVPAWRDQRVREEGADGTDRHG
jgi:hypothetical protein